MQYYVKIFNKMSSELVGYYKETGTSCITKLPKGMKYFNTWQEGYNIVGDIDEGFLRDKDGHYYTGHAVIYGDHTREPSKDVYNRNVMKGDEQENALETFIRQNSPRNRR